MKNVSGEGLVLARGGVENNNEVNKKINNNIINKEDIYEFKKQWVNK